MLQSHLSGADGYLTCSWKNYPKNHMGFVLSLPALVPHIFGVRSVEVGNRNQFWLHFAPVANTAQGTGWVPLSWCSPSSIQLYLGTPAEDRHHRDLICREWVCRGVTDGRYLVSGSFNNVDRWKEKQWAWLTDPKGTLLAWQNQRFPPHPFLRILSISKTEMIFLSSH